MTPDDLKLLCLKYGLIMGTIITEYEYVYRIYDPKEFLLSWDRYMGKFTPVELSCADPGDMETRVIEWSMKASFEVC